MRSHYLVVGQGLAGSLVTYHLLKKGMKVTVIDQFKTNSSSRVAAGLYNPITGQRVVKTWRAEELFIFLEKCYKELESLLETRFLFPKPIFRPFDTIAEQNDWFAQSTEPNFKEILEVIGSAEEMAKHYKAPFGGIRTKISGFVDLNEMLPAFQNYLRKRIAYFEERFDYEKLELKPDSISYNDIKANAVIFCEGTGGRQNPFFNYLPLNSTKGQLLDIEIEKYEVSEIISKGVFVIPKEGKQTVGSNYEWTFEDEHPSEKGKEEIELKLRKILNSPYTIVNQRAGVRPTVKDHRPLIGKHPEHSNVYLFNGMGTKGVSLAPFFSSHFVDHITEDIKLIPEADIQRFDYLYRLK